MTIIKALKTATYLQLHTMYSISKLVAPCAMKNASIASRLCWLIYRWRMVKEPLLWSTMIPKKTVSTLPFLTCQQLCFEWLTTYPGWPHRRIQCWVRDCRSFVFASAASRKSNHRLLASYHFWGRQVPFVWLKPQASGSLPCDLLMWVAQ